MTVTDTPVPAAETTVEPPASPPPASQPPVEPSRRRRRSLSIRSILLIMLLVVSIGSNLVVGVIGYINGTESLRQAAFDRLTEVRDSRAREITSLFTESRTRCSSPAGTAPWWMPSRRSRAGSPNSTASRHRRSRATRHRARRGPAELGRDLLHRRLGSAARRRERRGRRRVELRAELARGAVPHLPLRGREQRPGDERRRRRQCLVGGPPRVPRRPASDGRSCRASTTWCCSTLRAPSSTRSRRTSTWAATS